MDVGEFLEDWVARRVRSAPRGQEFVEAQRLVSVCQEAAIRVGIPHEALSAYIKARDGCDLVSYMHQALAARDWIRIQSSFCNGHTP